MIEESLVVIEAVSFLVDIPMGEENLIGLIKIVSWLDFVVGHSIQTFHIS